MGGYSSPNTDPYSQPGVGPSRQQGSPQGGLHATPLGDRPINSEDLRDLQPN